MLRKPYRNNDESTTGSATKALNKNQPIKNTRINQEARNYFIFAVLWNMVHPFRRFDWTTFATICHMQFANSTSDVHQSRTTMKLHTWVSDDPSFSNSLANTKAWILTTHCQFNRCWFFAKPLAETIGEFLEQSPVSTTTVPQLGHH